MAVKERGFYIGYGENPTMKEFTLEVGKSVKIGEATGLVTIENRNEEHDIWMGFGKKVSVGHGTHIVRYVEPKGFKEKDPETGKKVPRPYPQHSKRFGGEIYARAEPPGAPPEEITEE